MSILASGRGFCRSVKCLSILSHFVAISLNRAFSPDALFRHRHMQTHSATYRHKSSRRSSIAPSPPPLRQTAAAFFALVPDSLTVIDNARSRGTSRYDSTCLVIGDFERRKSSLTRNLQSTQVSAGVWQRWSRKTAAASPWRMPPF